MGKLILFLPIPGCKVVFYVELVYISAYNISMKVSKISTDGTRLRPIGLVRNLYGFAGRNRESDSALFFAYGDRLRLRCQKYYVFVILLTPRSPLYLRMVCLVPRPLPTTDT